MYPTAALPVSFVELGYLGFASMGILRRSSTLRPYMAPWQPKSALEANGKLSLHQQAYGLKQGAVWYVVHGGGIAKKCHLAACSVGGALLLVAVALAPLATIGNFAMRQYIPPHSHADPFSEATICQTIPLGHLKKASESYPKE